MFDVEKILRPEFVFGRMAHCFEAGAKPSGLKGHNGWAPCIWRQLITKSNAAVFIFLAGLLAVSQPTSAADGKFVNLSTRAFVGMGDEVIIGGFIIEDGPRQVLIQALGPELADAGVSNALVDPVLTIIQTAEGESPRTPLNPPVEIAVNDNWEDSQRQLVTDLWGGRPNLADGSLSSAVVVTLQPGSYTAKVEGKDGGNGVAIVEVYEIDFPGADGKFVNLSTRALVGTGDEVIIGGFIIEDGARQVLVQALGPELADAGVSNALVDPVLTIIQTAEGESPRTPLNPPVEIAVNDNWEDSQGQLITDLWEGSPNLMTGSLSSAVLATLEPGSYTALVEGKDGSRGVACVEVYAISGDTQPTFSSEIDDQSYTANTEISPLALPEAIGGNAPLAYSLTPDVPGLSFDAETRTLSGTPSTADTYEMTYEVVDIDGDSASLNFTITVNEEDSEPSFEGISLEDQVYNVGTEITALTLPEADGGDAPLTYSLTPVVPGLSFDATTRTLSGTPSTADTYEMTYEVVDTDDDSASLNFTITVNEEDSQPSFDGISVADQEYIADSEISPLNLPEAVGGNVPLAYSLTPDVPGLSFDPATRILSGTPSTADTYSMIFEVQDADEETASLTFTITVTEDLQPSLSGSVADQVYTAGTAISPLILPEADGGDTPLSYSLSPGVPGLSFNSATRILSGTPSAAGIYNMTFEVEDDDGDDDTLTFTITVEEADTVPSFSVTVADQIFIQNAQISALMLPEASGGNPPLQYTLTPDVPGLSFDPATRTLTGTPTTLGTTPMTYEVKDADDDTATLTFDIAVNEPDEQPRFSGTLSDQNYIQNLQITALTLPEAGGGNAPLTYTLTGAPPGLSFDATTRILSGTPSSFGSFDLTYEVRDKDGDTETLTFNITVAEDTAPAFSGPISDIAFIVGIQGGADLPDVEFGNAPLTYSFSPALSWLDIVGTVFFGTPSSSDIGSETITITVSDADGDTDSISFEISIEADTDPALPNVADKKFIQNSDIGTVALGAATGGNSPLIYTLSPVPAGLSFNAASQTLTGTPTLNFIGGQWQPASTLLTYSVTDADFDTDTETFRIRVEVDTQPVLASVSNQDYIEDSAIPTLNLPTSTSGNEPLTYTLTPDVPGLTFDSTARTVTGTPTAPGNYGMTYKVEDADNEIATATFAINVEADAMPTLSTVGDQNYIQNSDIGTLQLPASPAGNQPLTYTLGPSVPAGLSFDATARTLTGAPTGHGTFNMSYKVTDKDMDSYTATFTITVEEDTQPSLAAVGNQDYIQNSTYTLNLPQSPAGNEPLVYTLSPTVSGMTFDATARNPQRRPDGPRHLQHGIQGHG